MTARLAAMLPRLFALTLIGLLAATSLTFAAATRKLEKKESEAVPVQAGPKTLRVPDVRGQAYVFAKGILEDAGFAWRVVGSVKGYAANLVAVQNPGPGVEVLDNGAPTIELRLERNPDYAERGLPENTSPFGGSKLRLANDPQAAEEEKEPVAPAEEQEAEPNEDEASGASGSDEPSESTGREPDFAVPGAPAEPADEMPLPDRARLLEKRLAAAPKPTSRLVDWWLYQHSWIVTGARFGWHDGADALRILIRVDRSIQARWGFGARSTAVAKRALAEVERRAAE